MAHYKAVNKKHLVVAVVLVVAMVLATGFISYKIGYKQSTKDGQEPMENEIRLVQEHTAEAVKSMFLNIPEVRDALQEGKIYRTEMYWWNFDREYSMTVSYGKNRIYTDWCDLQR